MLNKVSLLLSLLPNGIGAYDTYYAVRDIWLYDRFGFSKGCISEYLQTLINGRGIKRVYRDLKMYT